MGASRRLQPGRGEVNTRRCGRAARQQFNSAF